MSVSTVAREVGRTAPAYALGLFTTIFAFNFLDRTVLAILLEPIKRELGVSDTQLGLLVGFAFVALYTLASLPIARLADRMSRRNILAIGVIVWSALTACCGLAQNFAQLVLFRTGVGIGEAAGSAPSISLIASYYSGAARTRAISIYSSGTYIGILLGFLVGGFVSQIYGWRAAFLVAALPGVLLAALLRLTVREPERAAAAGSVPRIAEVVRFLLQQRTFVLIVAGFALTSVAQFGIGAWVPTFFRRVHHLDGAHTGLVAGLVTGAFGIAGTWAGGYISGELGRKHARALLVVPALAVLGSGAAIVALGAAHGLTSAIVVLAVLVFLQAMHVGPIWALTQNLAQPRMRAVAFALLSAFANLIGLGCGPLVVGILNDALSRSYGEAAIRISLTALALFSVLGGSLFLIATRTAAADLARVSTESRS